MPVQPTAHYAMGGIPTDLDGRVIVDDRAAVVDGLYAAGECACVSVHGANRLGTNSLVDLIVFGRRAGIHMADFVSGVETPSLPDDACGPARGLVERLKSPGSGPAPVELRTRVQALMTECFGVYRNGETMRQAIRDLRDLRDSYRDVRCTDRNRSFNSALLELFELGNLLDNALLTAASAENREESRGAHSREDFPERDDTTWLKHTLARLEGDSVRIAYKPVDTSRWEPKPRVY